MILIKVELHSAITGKVTEIGRMTIANIGLSPDKTEGDYDVRLMRRGTTNIVNRTGKVFKHKRLSQSIWKLVSKALNSCGY